MIYANLWSHITISQYCRVGKVVFYALIGDFTYPSHPWIFPPFKGHISLLFRKEPTIGISFKDPQECA
jgi:hypothetical protein